MISDSQNIVTITHWFRSVKNNFIQLPNTKWPMADRIVTDFSWAFIHSVSDGWNNMSFTMYFNIVYAEYIMNTRVRSTGLVFIHLCCAHLIKNIVRDIKELFRDYEKQIRRKVIVMIASMFMITDYEELLRFCVLVCTLFLNPYKVDVIDCIEEIASGITDEEIDD
jgi:hypothetical protein